MQENNHSLIQKSLMKIVVGIIYKKGSVFITKRLESSHLAGYWEFPGGKVEQGETLEMALIREIKEEVDIIPLQFEFMQEIVHTYPDRKLELYFYSICNWEGLPFAREGQKSKWIKCCDLNVNQFPEASHPIVEKIKLGYFSSQSVC